MKLNRKGGLLWRGKPWSCAVCGVISMTQLFKFPSIILNIKWNYEMTYGKINELKDFVIATGNSNQIYSDVLCLTE